MSGYILSDHVYNLYIDLWSRFLPNERKEESECFSGFSNLKDLDQNLYHFCLCKWLIMQNDEDALAYVDSEFCAIQYLMGYIYRKGILVKKDRLLARSHFLKGAKDGHIPSKAGLYSQFTVLEKVVMVPYAVYVVLESGFIHKMHPRSTLLLM